MSDIPDVDQVEKDTAAATPALALDLNLKGEIEREREIMVKKREREIKDFILSMNIKEKLTTSLTIRVIVTRRICIR